MPYHEAVLVERHALDGAAWLTLLAPDLARAVRPGQLALLRCAPPTSADPLLRRALFCADADPQAGVVSLFVSPAEPGTIWLAAQPVGARLDVYGPVGTPFTLDNRTRNLLLVGAGQALPALMFLAQRTVAQGCAVVLLAAATTPLPPPYLLPADVEYQSVAAPAALLAALRAGSPALLAWADQMCAAAEAEQLSGLIDAVRTVRLRWERGFAQVALAGPAPCGAGACLACAVETRDGLRLRCKDGPVFDLRAFR
jgi:dihydroorotate dehydrogenase electron transfer subunit